MAGRRPHWPYLTLVALLAAAASSSHTLDIPYDGRFTFVRLRWGGGTTQSRSWSSAWNHDYPRAEQHLSQILRELTYLDIHTEGSRILSLDDPDLFRDRKSTRLNSSHANISYA